MHFRSQLQHPIKWWRYSHESRLVLLGTGELGLWLQVSCKSDTLHSILVTEIARSCSGVDRQNWITACLT